MASTQPNDLAILEAGHAIFGYLIDVLMEIWHVTIDNDFSRQINPLSDGGIFFRYIKNPDNLHHFDRDQFCLSNLSGLAADIVNEYDGKIPEGFFDSATFLSKLSLSYYIGDLKSFNAFFQGLQSRLMYLPFTYNQTSIKLLTNIFSNEKILPVLLSIREVIDKQKTIERKDLYELLDKSYLSEFKKSSWLNVKEVRKKLFF